MIRISAYSGGMVLGLLLATVPAQADHHLLKRALQEARCIPLRVERIPGQSAIVAYAVACLRPPRALVVVCDARACRAEVAEHHDRDDDEP